MRTHIAVAAVLVLVGAVTAAPPTCIPIDRPCVKSPECCDGCCSEEKCVKYADSCTVALNPCLLHQCPPNKICYLNQVQCNSADCPPLPACKDSDYDDYS